MAYDVTLYLNTSDTHVMDKQIALLATAQCDFKTPIDVENPTIYINADVSYMACNYIYIQQFGRYYYAKPTGGTSNTITLVCQSDPLMSFKTAILNSKAVIARNPWKYDKYIHDAKLPLEARTVTGTYKFPGTSHFSGTNNSYILTTIGSGGSSS